MGHPERRCKDHTKWDDVERCIYMVDAIAEQQYERQQQVQIQVDWWDFPVKPVYKVFWRDEVITGKVRSTLLQAVKTERLLDALALNMGGGRILNGVKGRQTADKRNYRPQHGSTKATAHCGRKSEAGRGMAVEGHNEQSAEQQGSCGRDCGLG